MVKLLVVVENWRHGNCLRAARRGGDPVVASLMASRVGIRLVQQWDIKAVESYREDTYYHPDRSKCPRCLADACLASGGMWHCDPCAISWLPSETKPFTEEYSDMAKKTVEPVSPPAKPQVPEDAPIVAKMIGKRKEFEARAKAAHEKTFEPLVTPSLYRLSPKAHALYQEWAQTTDAAHVGVSKKAVEGADEKGAKTLTHEHYEAGDTRLHEIFSGLAVVEDVDLPGESVIVE